MKNKTILIMLVGLLLISIATAGLFDIVTKIDTTNVEITIEDKGYVDLLQESVIEDAKLIDGLCQADVRIHIIVMGTIRYDCSDKLTKEEIIANRDIEVQNVVDAYIEKLKIETPITTAPIEPIQKGGGGEIIIK